MPPLEGLTIRLATPGDASRIAGVHVRSKRISYRPFLPWPYLDTLDQDGHRRDYWQPRLERDDSLSVAWLAMVRGVPAGLAAVGPPDGDLGLAPEGVALLGHLHVAPEFLGRGVGAALWRTALARMREQGFEEGALWVYEENDRARAFYERMGWAVDGAREPRQLVWPDGAAEVFMVRYRGVTAETR